MSYGEVFSALKQGVIDGQENPFSQIVPARFHEVQKYLSLSRHVYTPAYPLMSQRYFESLEHDMKRAIVDVAVEVGHYLRELGANEDVRYQTMLAEQLEISEIDRAAFEATTEHLYESFNEHYGPELVATIRSYRSQN